MTGSMIVVVPVIFLFVVMVVIMTMVTPETGPGQTGGREVEVHALHRQRFQIDEVQGLAHRVTDERLPGAAAHRQGRRRAGNRHGSQ